VRNLYYYNWQLQETVFGVVMDDIKERYEQDDIYFVSCKGALLPCWSNKFSDPLKCQICRFNQRSAFQSDFKKVKQLYIDDYCTKEEVEREFLTFGMGDYQSLDDIRGLVYKGINIGYGALSTYISSTRNRDALIDDDFRNYFNGLLKTQVFIKIAIDRIIEEVKPEAISIFNGRIHDTRPVFQTAVQKGIRLRGVETVVKGEFDYQRRIFENALPHDIGFQTQSIEKAWEESGFSLEEKRNIGKRFFENRRNNILARDRKVYTLDQKKGVLPENWDDSKRNIVIFNSSEDEFAAIGKEWDELALFKDQEIGIQFILSQIKDPTIHFYLRIHPNLKEVEYGYHKRLYDLDKQFSNVTIIGANSSVSTYTLMDHAEKVVVFGSSTGVEAAYSQKPVVLLGGSFYYHLDVAYTPKSKQEAINLIQSELKPKGDLGAIKFGFYLMHIDSYSKPIAYNAKPLKIGGRKLGYTFPHLKFLGSSLLHKFALLAIRSKYYIETLIKKPQLLELPRKEQ
jgi:hypothetical protein